MHTGDSDTLGFRTIWLELRCKPKGNKGESAEGKSKGHGHSAVDIKRVTNLVLSVGAPARLCF